MSICLIGFMGAGKSTIAKLLSPEYRDLDALIVEQIGQPISDFFAANGEAAFRQIEHEVLKATLGKVPVIATGGGIIEFPDNLSLLENTTTVYLAADFDLLYERIKGDEGRPVAQRPKNELKALYDKRNKLYEKVASLKIDVSQKSPDEIVEEISCKLHI